MHKIRKLWVIFVILFSSFTLAAPDCGFQDSGDSSGGEGDDEAGAPVICPETDEWTQFLPEGSGAIAPGTWLVNEKGDALDWGTAVEACAFLAQEKFCGLGSWRLPTLSEWRTLIDGCPGTETGGACPADDSCLSSASCMDWPSCWDECTAARWGGPGYNGEYSVVTDYSLGWRWTGSEDTADPDRAWVVLFEAGSVGSFLKYETPAVSFGCIAP